MSRMSRFVAGAMVLAAVSFGPVALVGATDASETTVDASALPHDPLPSVNVDPSTVSVEATSNGWQISWTESATSSGAGYYIASFDGGSCAAMAVAPGTLATCLIEGDASGELPVVAVSYFEENLVPTTFEAPAIEVDASTVSVTASDGGWLVSWTEPGGTNGSGSYLASFDGGSCKTLAAADGAAASCLIEGDTTSDVPVVEVTYSQPVPVDLQPAIAVDPSTVFVTASDGGWLVSWTEPGGTNGSGSYLASFDGGSCQTLATADGAAASCLIAADTTGDVPVVEVTYSQQIPVDGPVSPGIIEVDPSTISITPADGGWKVSWTEPIGARIGGFYVVSSDLGSCVAEVGTEGAVATCLIEGDSTGPAPEVSVSYNSAVLAYSRGGPAGSVPTSTIPQPTVARTQGEVALPTANYRFFHHANLVTAEAAPLPKLGLSDAPLQPSRNSLPLYLVGVLVIVLGTAALVFRSRIGTN